MTSTAAPLESGSGPRGACPGSAAPPERAGWPQPDGLVGVGAEAVGRILEIQDLLSRRRSELIADDRLAGAMLDALDEFVRAARQAVLARDTSAATWIVGRDTANVAHAVARGGVTSACGLIGFVELEQDKWPLASGRRCRRCAALVP